MYYVDWGSIPRPQAREVYPTHSSTACSRTLSQLFTVPPEEGRTLKHKFSETEGVSLLWEDANKIFPKKFNVFAAWCL